MRNHDRRVAVLLDSHRAWLYAYEPGKEPTISFILGNVPRGIRRVVEDYMTRRVKSDRARHIQELYKHILHHLEGATEITLFGPGHAKENVANLIAETPRFKNVVVRTQPSQWMEETAFEQFSRQKLRIPDNTPSIYLRESNYIPRKRLGSPGAPVDPADYRRTSEPKWKDGNMGVGKST
jgi:hypothetical protein